MKDALFRHLVVGGGNVVRSLLLEYTHCFDSQRQNGGPSELTSTLFTVRVASCSCGGPISTELPTLLAREWRKSLVGRKIPYHYSGFTEFGKGER